ncbi:hypothetical protein CLOSTASPAR_01857 [[Clostridium] asparagiforme DSM 15981]|uniref:Uncharacterized protein n=1 Tax=[Clostridium] asparagiforme DSM 15981 TaxID=518636 RepID=C0CXY2_9FIRM|nr:hypothetical protein CLOSTASPAR_01857 [[Clostridium] asparagiforme DSM 15981]
MVDSVILIYDRDGRMVRRELWFQGAAGAGPRFKVPTGGAP